MFSNSHRYSESAGRFDKRTRPEDGLPPPQKILTGPQRSQVGRFGAGTNSTAPSNEPPARIQSFTDQNPQSQPMNSLASNASWNSEQNNKSNYNSTGFSNQSTFNRQQSNPSQHNQYQRTDENQPSAFGNSNRFPSNTSANQQQPVEPKRSYGRVNIS